MFLLIYFSTPQKKNIFLEPIKSKEQKYVREFCEKSFFYGAMFFYLNLFLCHETLYILGLILIITWDLYDLVQKKIKF